MDTDFARFVIVRNTFREYMQSCSEFWKAFQRSTIAIKSSERQRQVLQTHLRLQTLWLEQQRLRFEYRRNRRSCTQDEWRGTRRPYQGAAAKCTVSRGRAPK